MFSGENTAEPPEVPFKNTLKTMGESYIFEISLQNIRRISVHSIFFYPFMDGRGFSNKTIQKFASGHL